MPKLTKYASLLLLLLLPLLLRAADDIVLPDTALPMAEREAAFKKTAMEYIRPVTDVNAAKNAIAAKRIADPPSVGQDVHRWFRDTLAAFENACGCRVNVAAGMTDHFWANTFKEQRDAPLVTDGTACQLGFRLLYARLGERDKATYTLTLHDTLTQAARDVFPQGKLDTLFATLAAFKETLPDIAQTRATTAISNALWALLEGGYKHDPKYSATLALKDKNSLLLPDTCPAPALAQDYPGGARYYGVATGQALGYTLNYKTGADNPDNVPLLLHRPDGAEVPATTTGSVTAAAEGEADVYAFYRLEGKYTTQTRVLEGTRYTLVANSPKDLKLVLVPVGNAAAPDEAALRQALNRIYAPAAVTWVVTKAAPFSYADLPAEGLATKSALVSAYSPDMNALIKAYKKKVKSWEDDTYYLFAVPRFAEPSVSGYMPLQSAFGFVASDNPTTLAHELGHGAFTLKHTWLQWPALTPSSTQNLMDYNNGSTLWKPQWDMVHNQKYHISWFDDDEEKQYVSESNVQEVARFINYIKCAKAKGNSSVDVHYAWKLYENIQVGSLISLLNNGQSVISPEVKQAKLTVVISDGILSKPTDLHVGYKTFALSLDKATNSVKDGLIIPTNNGQIRFYIPDGTSSELASMSMKWLLQECGLNGTTPAAPTVNNAQPIKAKDALLFSQCELEQLNRSNREKLIAELKDNVENVVGLDKDTYQYLLVNVLSTIPAGDKAYFYNLFTANPQWIIKLYEHMVAEPRDKVVKILLNLWYFNNPDRDRQTIQNVFVISKSIFGKADNKLRFEGSQVVFTTPEYVVSGETAVKTNKKLFSAGLFEPVLVSMHGETSPKAFTPLPALFVKSYTDKENWENVKITAEIALNVALLPLGVGEITAGVSAVRLGKNAAFVGGLVRTALGSADLLFSIRRTYCLGVQDAATTEFCEALQELELYVSMGLVTASAADIMYTRLSKSYTKNIKGKLMPEQVNYLEKDLGVPVNATTETVQAGSKVIARSGAELRKHLSTIVNKPVGVPYKGKGFRNIKIGEPVEYATGINPKMVAEENRFGTALYISKDEVGNLNEALHYSGGSSGRQLYEMEVDIKGLLDLTDAKVVEQLGTTFEQLKLANVNNMYEYTQEVAIWAKNNGYSGIKYYGARSNSDYINFAIFEQTTVNNSIKQVNPTKW